jgi:hypothetical protein
LSTLIFHDFSPFFCKNAENGLFFALFPTRASQKKCCFANTTYTAPLNSYQFDKTLFENIFFATQKIIFLRDFSFFKIVFTDYLNTFLFFQMSSGRVIPIGNFWNFLM